MLIAWPYSYIYIYMFLSLSLSLSLFLYTHTHSHTHTHTGSIVIEGRACKIISREHVAQLRTREEWSRRACAVREGEKPVKTLRSTTPQSLQRRGGAVGELELFASWQVFAVQRGRSAAGCVPKNARGHVEMLTPYQLPEGCAYVADAAAGLVARRLKVHYPPAL